MNNITTKQKKENEIVLKIHNEIDSAQDRLLAEANLLIGENSVSNSMLSKVQRLKNLGFNNTEEVRSTNEKLVINNMTTVLANTIKYYKETYPFLKFLTIEEFEKICDKYNLIYAPVTNYKKDVPEDNILEIESAQVLLRKDEQKNMTLLRVQSSNRCESDLTTDERKLIYDTGFYVETESLNEHSGVYGYSPEVFVSKLLNRKIDFRWSSIHCDAISTVDKQGLFIAAPKSHFDVDGLTEVGKKGFFKKILLPEPKDPIVFRFVNGGLQILSKWGLEGDDLRLNSFEIN